MDWSSFVRIDFDDVISQRAIELTKNHFLRGADSIHLASALFLKEKFSFEQDTFQFVSADDELNFAAQNHNIIIINPQ